MSVRYSHESCKLSMFPVLRPVYSDTTQLNSTSNWVELRRYKLAFRQRVKLVTVVTCSKQKVWPPGSTDTVCPRRPVMTYVQHWLMTWPCDLDLSPWRSSRLWLMRFIVLHPYTEFEVRRRCHSQIWRTMCVSINGPSDPDLWPFDLETGMRVASKMGKLPSTFAHATPFGSRIIRYVRDVRTDCKEKHGETDKSNAYFPLPYAGVSITRNSAVVERPRDARVISKLCSVCYISYQLSVIQFIQRAQTSSLNAIGGATTQGASCPCGGGSSMSWDLNWRTKLYCIDAARVVTGSKLVAYGAVDIKTMLLSVYFFGIFMQIECWFVKLFT